MSERVNDIKAQRVDEPLFISSSGAKARRAKRDPDAGTSRAAPKFVRTFGEADDMPDMPVMAGRQYHTYALDDAQRKLLERHALQRFQSGFSGRLDFSQPLRDIIEFFQANEKEGNDWIAQKYKNQGKR